MKQEDIIRMAREAGFETEYRKGKIHGFDRDGDYTDEIKTFAALVAAAEREACAKVCEDGINNATDWDSSAWDQACENRAYAIRARGQA
jgi:hypothetical protein